MALGDIILTGTISTSAPSDVYPTHSANTGKGGYRSVADEAARNAIPTERREHGMIVYVQDVNKKYILEAGLTNSDWKEEVSSSNYTSSVPSTVQIGGLPAGFTAPDGISIETLLDQMLHPYQKPEFTSLAITGLKTYEVGEDMPANSSFTFTFSNSSNVKPDSLKIEDVTGGNTLVENTAITSPCATTHAAINKTSAGTNVFKATASNTNNEVFTKEVTATWMWAIYSGTSTNETLDSAGITGLANKKLASGSAGTHALEAGGYKYFAIPESMATPKKFVNADNGFGLAMNDPETVSVTNAYSQTCNYKVYRSTFELGGAINMKVE